MNNLVKASKQITRALPSKVVDDVKGCMVDKQSAA